jgi:hypothetical protein
MLLSFSDGVIKLDGAEIEGIVKSVSVSADVKLDEQKVDGLSGTKKVPVGWSDADITVTLELLTDDAATCYERLQELNRLFKSTESAASPKKKFEIANRHTAARGVRSVVFSKLDSSETSDDDVIAVTLQFIEYEPAVVPSEKAAAAGSGGSALQEEPEPEASLMVDVK